MMISDSTARGGRAFDHGWNSNSKRDRQATCCDRKLFSEVLDLATGVGLLVFTLAPFALPALALVAVAAVLLMIPVLVGAILAAPILVGWRWWRSHARASRVSQPATVGREVRRPGVSTPGASGDPTEIVDTESLPVKVREMS
jgi:hypothetical protein